VRKRFLLTDYSIKRGSPTTTKDDRKEFKGWGVFVC
jgi:hypothetical protein